MNLLSRIKRIALDNPLLTIFGVAIIVRLLAVIFSKGYMASDDHFETIEIAYQWLRTGVIGEDSLLTWVSNSPAELNRFPLYNLFLLGLMKLNFALGIEKLESMMFSIRAVHAALSLIPVYLLWSLTLKLTKSRSWALIAGLVAALHFGAAFLGVRNLIEVVGGHFWLLTIFYCYKFETDRQQKWLILAGLMTGLAWMIRFQIALAVLPVPFILWYQYKEIRPAIIYSLSVGSMLLLSGFADLWLLGRFFGTTVSLVQGAASGGAMYNTIVLIYPVEILAFCLPPLSIVGFYFACRKRFWQNHMLLCGSSLSFILIHTLLSNRQERFMLPILPVLLLILILSIWQQQRDNTYLFRRKRLWQSLTVVAVTLNLILLVPFSLNYGHKGLVEPMVWIDANQTDNTRLTITSLSPGQSRIFPYDYAGYERVKANSIYAWDQLSANKDELLSTDYFLLYPPDSLSLKAYVDSLEQYVGGLTEVHYSPPSTIDYILHVMNPRHNRKNDAWVYQRTITTNPISSTDQ